MRDFLQWFSREKQWITAQHVQLCRIPAPTFFEQRRAEWMAAQFRDVGCIVRIDRAGNVIAYAGRESEGPLIAITAHLDTVLAPRNNDEISFGADGRLVGPGVSDNGAGLTALLAIAHAVQCCPLAAFHAPSLVLIANVGEEGEGNLSGMRYLCRSPLGGRIGAFIVLDGPNLDHITSQALASRRFDITITGPGGHSWSDYGIANPVHALSRAISLFTDARSALIGPPRSSFNFGILEGGSSINSIPSHARAKLDVRSESSAKLEEFSGLLTACVERAIETENESAAGRRVSAKIREIGARPGGKLAGDAAILTYIRAVDAHFGIRSRLDCASTDANVPLSMNVPAISIGAGGARWRRPHAAGMVPPRGPRTRSQAHCADRLSALARHGRRPQPVPGGALKRYERPPPGARVAPEMAWALIGLALGSTFIPVNMPALRKPDSVTASRIRPAPIFGPAIYRKARSRYQLASDIA